MRIPELRFHPPPCFCPPDLCSTLIFINTNKCYKTPRINIYRHKWLKAAFLFTADAEMLTAALQPLIYPLPATAAVMFCFAVFYERNCKVTVNTHTHSHTHVQDDDPGDVITDNILLLMFPPDVTSWWWLLVQIFFFLFLYNIVTVKAKKQPTTCMCPSLIWLKLYSN